MSCLCVSRKKKDKSNIHVLSDRSELYEREVAGYIIYCRGGPSI